MKRAVTCAQCGTKMRVGIRFCSKCGHELRSAEEAALAAAAQAEEAAANELTEEEVAALQAGDATPAAVDAAQAEPSAETVTEAPAAEPEISPALREAMERAEAERAREADAHATVLHNQRARTDAQVARRTAAADTEVARIEGQATLRRADTEGVARVEAARRDSATATVEARVARREAVEETRASRREAAAEARLSAIRLSDARKAARRAQQEAESNLRAAARVDERDAARAARVERQTVEARAFESRVADVQQQGEAAVTERTRREAMRRERLAVAQREEDRRADARGARALDRDLRAEERRAAKIRRGESATAVFARRAENEMEQRRVAMERAALRQRAAADAEMQDLRLREELRTAKRQAAERLRATRALMAEEARVAARPNDELRRTVREKTFENRLYAKQTAAEKRVRRRRESDIERTAARQAAVRERETRRLGSLEYRAASVSLTAEAAEARRRAAEVEQEMETRRHEERLADRTAADEKKIIRLRAADREKHARTAATFRAKSIRALGRAEMRSLRLTQTDEIDETRRKTDEVELNTARRRNEAKRYSKSISAQRRLVRTEAADADRLQRTNLRSQERFQEARTLEEGRATRRTEDDSRQAITEQRRQDTLYREKRASEDKIAARAHKLELRAMRFENARQARLASAREDEQRRSLRLAERREKAAIKRAKRIAQIAGTPVSLVPALSGEATSSALLPGTATTVTPPDALLDATAAMSARDRYKAYREQKKRDAARVRYVKINVRNERKYFSTTYKQGEVLVAKRTVRVARVQAILAVLLMAVALFATLLPIFSIEGVESLSPVLKNIILDGQEIVSVESLLTTSQGAEYEFENVLGLPVSAVSYFWATIGRIGESAGLSVIDGLRSFVDAGKTAYDGSQVLSYLGSLIVFAALSLAMLLTPIVILVNLIIAIVRLISRFLGKGVGITRVMKNLRVSYCLLGLYVLPALAFGFKAQIGFWIYLGSFGVAVVLNLLLNFIKKYEPCDRKYQILVQIGGLIRGALVVAFLYFFASSNVFAVSEYGSEPLKLYANAALLGVSFVLVVLSAVSLPSFGFEVMGYAKWQTLHHIPLCILSVLASAFAILPRFIGGPNGGHMLYLAAGAMGVFIIVTVVFGLIRALIAKRNCMHDEILDAISEGFPLK